MKLYPNRAASETSHAQQQNTHAGGAVDGTLLLLPAAEAARRCHVSESAWWAYHAAGRCPAPVRLGGRTLWRAEELGEWVDAGCPPRAKWGSRKGVRR